MRTILESYSSESAVVLPQVGASQFQVGNYFQLELASYKSVQSQVRQLAAFVPDQSEALDGQYCYRTFQSKKRHMYVLASIIDGVLHRYIGTA